MGNKHIRINTKDDNAAVKITNKAPPFSDEMKHDGAVSFDTRKIRREDIRGHDQPDAASGSGTLPFSRRNGRGGRKSDAATGGGASPFGRRNGKGGRKPDAAASGGASPFGRRNGKGGRKSNTAAPKNKIQPSKKNAVKGKSKKISNGFRHIGKGGKNISLDTITKYHEDLQSERKDNLGLRTIDESINTVKRIESLINQIDHAAKGTQKAFGAVKENAKKAAKAAKITAETMAKAAKQVAAGIGKLIVFLVAHPIILVVIMLLIVMIILISTIFTSFQSTPKNLAGDDLYDKIRTYLQKKDADILMEFEEYENQPEFSDIDDVIKIIEVYPATPVRLMAAFLIAKYENALTLEIAKSEIDAIHSQLYHINHEVDEDEKVLTVTLTGQTLSQYFDENIDSLLTPRQKASYKWYVFISGLFGFGPPFEDENYMAHVTQEFGVPSYADPNRPHRGIDFAYPTGTPILNVVAGKVVAVSNHYSWGLNAVIESEDGIYRVRYAHMSVVNVNVGETVSVGDVVGLVGSTGLSTGAHLHLEIEENGQLINPREVLPD